MLPSRPSRQAVPVQRAMAKRRLGGLYAQERVPHSWPPAEGGPRKPTIVLLSRVLFPGGGRRHRQNQLAGGGEIAFSAQIRAHGSGQQARGIRVGHATHAVPAGLHLRDDRLARTLFLTVQGSPLLKAARGLEGALAEHVRDVL